MLAHWICPECPSHLRFVFGERCGNEIPCLQDSQGRPLEFQIMRTSTIYTEFLIVFEYCWLPEKPVCSILFWTLATLRTSRHNRRSTRNFCKLIFVSFCLPAVGPLGPRSCRMKSQWNCLGKRCSFFLPSLFFSQIAIAIGLLTSNRGGGRRTTLADRVQRTWRHCCAIVGCHCSVLWFGGRVTTNFGGVDVVPLVPL